MFKKIMLVMVMLALAVPVLSDMNLNVYLEAAAGLGYKTEAAGTDVVWNIQPRSGERIVIIGGQFWTGATEHNAYFMYPAMNQTTTTALAITDTAILATDTLFDNGGNSGAIADFLAVEMDDGSYHFAVLTSVNLAVGTGGEYGWAAAGVVTVAAAAGNKIFFFGVETDGAEFVVNLPDSAGTIGTSATQNLVTLPSTSIVGKAKGDPMKILMENATAAGYIGYITYGYINK